MQKSLSLILCLFLASGLFAGTYTEDFSTSSYKAWALTTAAWSPASKQLVMASYLAHSGGLAGGGLSGSTIPTGGSATAVAFGDMNGDGHLDLVVANAGGSVKLYLNNGTADPFNGVTPSTLSSGTDPRAVAVGDVDGDGDLDLVVGNNGQAKQLFLNNGSADPFNSVAGSAIGADTDNTLSIVLADFDGDGDLDVAAGNNGQASKLYLNNGSATPFNGVAGGAIGAAHATMALAAADMNRDGRPDLVAGNYGQPCQLFLNNGTADPFGGVSGADITTDSRNTTSLALGDVDADGDIDLVAGNSGQTNRLYLNNGTADPFNGAAGSDISPDTDATTAVGLADVDSDGDLDLVAGNYGQVSKIYLNNGTVTPFAGAVVVPVTALAGNTLGLALGDVDGDGDPDLVLANDAQDALYFNNNCAPSPFAGVTGAYLYDTGSTQNQDVLLGDVNGDKLPDVVAIKYGAVNRLSLNNGSPDPFNGVAAVDIGSDTSPAYAGALGDVDGDGRLDLVVGNDNGTNRLYLNNGTANPFGGVAGRDITSDVRRTWCMALADMNGDGRLDLVTGNFRQKNRLYLNNGTADPFNGVVGTDIGSNADDTWDLVVADMNGDGYPDLVTAESTAGIHVYLNNGTANPFSGVVMRHVSSDAFSSIAVAVGDVNGDGHPDIVAGNNNQVNRLYLNNGTADPFSGVTGTDVGTEANQTWALALADMDCDGRLDLVEGNMGQNAKLYLNNGTATPFNSSTPGTAILAGDTQNTVAIAVGDLDGDGDPDLLRGNSWGSVRRYLNGAIRASAGRYNSSAGLAGSLPVDQNANVVTQATLNVTQSLPANTFVQYWLSNDNGKRWYLAKPGSAFSFPTVGSDLCWRADMGSYSPLSSPAITALSLAYVQSTDPPTITPTFTASPSFSATATATPSATATATATGSDTVTASPSATHSLSATGSPTETPTATASPSATASSTGTATASSTETPSATATHSSTASSTETPTASASATASATETPSATATHSPTASSTETPTASASATASATETPSATATHSPTDSPTETASASASPSATASPTETPTASSTPSATASATETATASASPSATASATETATASASPSATASATETATASASPSATPSPSGSTTASASPSITASPTPTGSFTPGPPATAAAGYDASGLGRTLLAPVPASRDQAVRLFFKKAPAASNWTVYNMAGDRVAALSFGAEPQHCWPHRGIAPGIYLARIEVGYADGDAETLTQKIALLW